MIVDRKYSGVIIKADGERVDDWILFRAKDKLVPEMLEFYISLCMREGCDQKHIDGLISMHLRVVKFQEDNPTRVKIPDTFDKDMIVEVGE